MLQFCKIDDLLVWVNNQKRFTTNNLDTNLDKMNFLMGLFKHPEKKFKSIHVTGTNGKGSTVSYLKNIYLKKGLNVGTFTSPYVTHFNERINYNNQDISDEDLIKYSNLILSKYDILRQNGFEEPTFFEFITAVCFVYFGNIKELDIAIIEVGMGGRLDATNIIIPFCSIITNVSYDHMNILGDTLDKILMEKLGIVKKNIPLITSIQDDNLLSIINNYCVKYNSQVYKVDSKRLKINKTDIYTSDFSYDGCDYELTLPGDYQIMNALCAIECVKTINNFESSNFYISNELLYEGLKNTTWPGRLEKISNQPLIYLDGGHNIDCINKVSDFINSLNLNHTRAIVSISNDKLKEEMVKKLDTVFDEIIFTTYTYSRSAQAIELYNLSNNKNKKVIEDIHQAIDYVYNQKDNYFNLFIGSLYLISDVRQIIININSNKISK